MLSFLEGAAWVCTIALVLKLIDYQIPFAHHLDRVIEPPGQESTTDTPQMLPPEPPTALRAGQLNFVEQWNANNDAP